MMSNLVLENLPTGKPHLSFSEISVWLECSFKHKLKFIDGHDKPIDSPNVDFGSACHAACENFLKTREMKPEIAAEKIRTFWQVANRQDADDWITQANAILLDVPAFLENTFPKWEYVSAEHLLYEQIASLPHAFKGLIDGIIVVHKGKKTINWLIDWKTTSWGWKAEKKSDRRVQMQLVYYKHFWSQKTNIPIQDIRCGFVLLKRAAKPDKHCELVPVSVGQVPINRSLIVIDNMLSSIKKGRAIKNRYSCEYCEFKDTNLCT